MVPGQPAGSALDIGEAFGFVFRSTNWFGKLLIGSACLLFSWLILPSLILVGYTVAVGRVIRGGGRDLPAWDDIGQKLVDGFLLTLTLLVWALPAVLVFILVFIVGLAAGGCSTEPDGSTSCTNPGAFLVLLPVSGVLLLLWALLYPAIWAQYLQGGISASFDVGGVWSRFRSNLGLALIVLLLYIVASLASYLGFFLFVVGILLTSTYASFVQAHVLGQYARLTAAPPAPAPMPIS